MSYTVGVSVLWRIEFKREMQPLKNNLTLMRVYEDESTKCVEEQYEIGSRGSDS